MDQKKNIRGVGKIEIGEPGDGVVGGALTEFPSEIVVLSSMSLDGGEATDQNIATEGADTYATVGTGSNPATSTFKLLEVTGADAVMLMGGTWDEPTKKWSAPIKKPNKYLSVVITDIEGNKITFPYAKVNARDTGNITKGEFLSVEVKITANIPVAADGTEGAPYERQLAV